jgi:hypothetical protein
MSACNRGTVRLCAGVLVCIAWCYAWHDRTRLRLWMGGRLRRPERDMWTFGGPWEGN